MLYRKSSLSQNNQKSAHPPKFLPTTPSGGAFAPAGLLLSPLSLHFIPMFSSTKKSYFTPLRFFLQSTVSFRTVVSIPRTLSSPPLPSISASTTETYSETPLALCDLPAHTADFSKAWYLHRAPANDNCLSFIAKTNPQEHHLEKTTNKLTNEGLGFHI